MATLRAAERALIAPDLVMLAAVARRCEVLVKFDHTLFQAGIYG